MASGITWVNAAGNEATTTYAAGWNDPDGNNIYNFPDGSECNPIELHEDSHEYVAQIRWADTWGDLNSEVHLVLKSVAAQDTVLATSSFLPVVGSDKWPLEQLRHTTSVGEAPYCLSVELLVPAGKTDFTPPLYFQMQSLHGHDLGLHSKFGSITSPAEATVDGMLAVGAASFADTATICARSSRGPAWTGDLSSQPRVKPDIVGGVATCEQGPEEYWHGTGEAAAHVAGMAALVKQLNWDYTPAQTANYLIGNAQERPAESGDIFAQPDSNNTWGHGFALLPAGDVADKSPTDRPAATPTATATATPPAIFPWPTPDATPPAPPATDALKAHGGLSWYSAELRGKGVKIGIVDWGFNGFDAALMGTELPSVVNFRCFVTEEGLDTSHDFEDCKIDASRQVQTGGTQVVKAVFDIAPEAEYYLGNMSSGGFGIVQHGDVVDWMIGQGVDVIVNAHPLRWLSDGSANTGVTIMDQLSNIAYIKRATDNGIVWATSAGNRAKSFWSGTWNDPDGNGWHNFSGDVECNPITPDDAARLYTAEMRWADTWGDQNTDLNLVLMNTSASPPELVATSAKLPGLDGPKAPLENLFTEVDASSSYCMQVELKAPACKTLTPPAFFQLYSRQGALGIPSLYASIPPGAEAGIDGMLAVGSASFDSTSTICELSGRGPVPGFTPTRIKPDIVGGASACAPNPADFWLGSGEAAAHVGGLAALVSQRYPDYAPAQVTAYLTDNAAARPGTDPILGASADPNNTWGHGFTMLPDDLAPACVQAINGDMTVSGSWNDSCLSETRPNDSRNGGEAGKDYYARFYTFTLDNESDVTITLTSDDDPKVDTFLYLLNGHGGSGSVKVYNDDIDDGTQNRDSRIQATALAAGDYTIEATTYDPDKTGNFTLVVEIDEATEPPPPTKYKAISSGANHVCAIAMDGSIMCWGDDSHGQVSDRPTRGVFTEISSGDNHTCALRDDGAAICWGSITLP